MSQKGIKFGCSGCDILPPLVLKELFADAKTFLVLGYLDDTVNWIRLSDISRVGLLGSSHWHTSVPIR